MNICEAKYRRELVKWRPPNIGWIKVNSDGASSKNGDWSAIGGVLRDATGNWIEGYQRYVGRGSTLNAELWTILQGLQVAKARGYVKVVVESDCFVTLKMINDCLTRTIMNISCDFESVVF